MDVEIRHTYPVSYVPFRHLITKVAYLEKYTTISIKEVAEAEVKPAFRIRGSASTRFAPKKDGSPRTMLSHGGKLWLEVGPSDEMLSAFSNGIPRGTFLDACEHLESKHKRFEVSGRFDPDTRKSIEDSYPYGPRLQQWNDDNGVIMSAKLAARATDAMVVNGTVYVREYEPVWRVGKVIGLSMVTVRPDIQEQFQIWYPSGRAASGVYEYWRADRRSEAEAHVRDGIADNGHSIEVLDPSCLRYNDDGDAMVATLGRVAQSLSYCLEYLPRDAVSAFYDVRAALTSTGGGFGPAIIGALRSIAALDPEKGNHKAEETIGQANKEVLAALSRWDSRPAFRQEWATYGLTLTASLQGKTVVRELLDMGATSTVGRLLSVDMVEWEKIAGSGAAHILSAWSSPNSGSRCLAAALVTGGDNPAVTCVMGQRGCEVPAEALAAFAAHARSAGITVPDVGGPLPVYVEDNVTAHPEEYEYFKDEGEGIDENEEGFAP